MMQMTKLAIGLGSNLGDRLTLLKSATRRLQTEVLEKVESSSVYETQPWGITEQPVFLNAVIVGYSDWKPPALINYLKALEKELGRTSTVKNGPRTIDLDLLIWGEKTWESEGVTVPHPGMAERDFVLIPLQEVWSDWVHPEKKKTVNELTVSFLKNAPSSAKVFAPHLLDTRNL